MSPTVGGADLNNKRRWGCAYNKDAGRRVTMSNEKFADFPTDLPPQNRAAVVVVIVPAGDVL